MRTNLFTTLVLLMSFLSLSVFSQTDSEQDLLGLPGDNLDLYAVLNLFQKSKTIEGFEKSLNEEKTGINNLDLNNDEKVDFIKVVTEKDGDNFLFILQDPISEKETQDVAVISVSKDSAGKVSMQIIGDKDLYGKNYVIEPTTKGTPAVTANPGYTGDEPPVESVPASTTVVVVESAPVVQYVYSPAYVPYYPPYYYGYYPPYFAAFTVMAVGIYRHNNYYNHYGYHGGGYGNTVVINNNKQINHYNNNNRNSSNTVNNNVKNGNYNTAGKGSTRQSGASASTRPSASQSGRATTGSSASTRPSTSQSGRASTGSSASSRPSTSQSGRSSAGASSASRSRSSSSMGSRGGGGRRR